MSIEKSGDGRELSLGEIIAIGEHERVKKDADKKAARLARALNVIDAAIDSPLYAELLDTLSLDARAPVTDADVLDSRAAIAEVVEYELAIGEAGMGAAKYIRQNGLPS